MDNDIEFSSRTPAGMKRLNKQEFKAFLQRERAAEPAKRTGVIKNAQVLDPEVITDPEIS